MKCCHLVAALALAGCGLNTSALPSTGRHSDAGVGSAPAQEEQSLAGSPLTWPTRRRPAERDQDSGSDDTKDDAASKPAQPSRGGSSADRDAQTDPNDQAAPTTPGGASSPSGQPPGSGGGAKPGAGQASPSGSSSGNNGSSSSNGTGTTPDGGGSTPADPDSDDSADEEADHDSNGGQSSGSNGGQSSGSNGGQSSGSNGGQSSGSNSGQSSGSNGGQSSGSNSGQGSGPNGNGNGNGNGSQQPNHNDAVSIIVDLVIAILDLSLGPIRPAEIEALVSSILVLSLAPAELAAESLVAVLDALEDTRICVDHPERCNPLCTNLESDCSACGRDKDCIERIEEMCQVKLPRTCL